jgi:hypothetical protein
VRPRHLVPALLAALALSACAGRAARTRDVAAAPPVFPPAGAAGGDPGAEVLAAESLARFVRGREAELQACYEEALARAPVLRGRVILRFTIRPDGTVDDVVPWYDSLGGGVARPCLVDRVAAWQTPFRPIEPVPVEYPLAFAPPARRGAAVPPEAAEAPPEPAEAPPARLEAAAGRRPVE